MIRPPCQINEKPTDLCDLYSRFDSRMIRPALVASPPRWPAQAAAHDRLPQIVAGCHIGCHIGCHVGYRRLS